MKILITGVSSGVGYACVKYFLAQGHEVIGVSRSAEGVFKEQAYHAYNVDFSAVQQLECTFKHIIKVHSDIDILLCNAGFGQFAQLEQFSFTQMQKLMNVNFMAHALLIKLLLPQLRKQAQAKLVTIGSECALSGSKLSSMYSASKFAFRGFLQSIRKEVSKDDVAVSLINPGLIKTSFYDGLSFKPGDRQENAISVDQIVNSVAFICQLENNAVVEEINILPLQNVVQRTGR